MLLGTIFFALVLFASTIALLVLWATTKKHVFGLLLAGVWFWFFISDSTVYGSFWESFYEDQVVSKVESSRPGQLTIGWKSEKEGTFGITEIAGYASQNEWTLADSLILPYDSLRVRLDRFGTDPRNYGVDYSLIIFRNNILPDLEKNINYKVYIFETNVSAEEPGPVNQTRRNGFVILNSNGKQLRVYHFWGEV